MTTLKEIGIVFGIIGLVFFVCLIFNFLVFNHGLEQTKNFLSETFSKIKINTISQNITISNDKLILSFYPHWKYLPIKYYFDDSKGLCSLDEKENIIRAFNLIEQKTGIYFKEEENINGIKINCYPEKEYVEHIRTMGETSIKEGLFNEITSANISFYTDGTTLSNYNDDFSEYGGKNGFPYIETHEILHTLGIGHIEDKISIMNPFGNEETRMDSSITECLTKIYSENKNYSCDGIPLN